MFTPALRIGYAIWTMFVFSIAVVLTRATRRRVVGALVAVLAFTAVSAPIDEFGGEHGLWTYPSCFDPPHPPTDVYFGQALFFVGCIALVGWRVRRAFGARGLALFVALAIALGIVRDFTAAAVFPQMLRFGPFPGALVADAAAWSIVVLFALAIPRIVSGAAKEDRPRGIPAW